MQELGGGFRDAYTLRCAFGSSAAPVLARYVDEAQLECSSPVHATGSASVLLSMNGQQYAPSGVAFTYQSAASVSYLSPASALSEGGTPVTVLGGGFSAAAEAAVPRSALLARQRGTASACSRYMSKRHNSYWRTIRPPANTRG